MQYHIARNGQQAGTFSEEEVRARLQTNEFSPSDLCWTDGMADWQPIGVRLAQVATAAGEPASGGIGTGEINPYAPPQATILAPAGSGGLELASPVDRLIAFIIDFAVGLPCGFLIGLGSAMSANSDSATIASGLTAVGGLLFLALAIYTLVLLATRGQTIGKKVRGIRIVTFPDGANPGGVKTILLRGFVNGLIGMVPVVGVIYALADIFFIFREDRRCIHDLIAGTQVVKGQPPGF